MKFAEYLLKGNRCSQSRPQNYKENKFDFLKFNQMPPKRSSGNFWETYGWYAKATFPRGKVNTSEIRVSSPECQRVSAPQGGGGIRKTHGENFDNFSIFQRFPNECGGRLQVTVLALSSYVVS
jgi:hypothetical protein